MIVTEIVNADLAAWVPGTRFFRTADNRYFVIDADLGDYDENSRFVVVRRPTQLLYCNADATVTDLVPDETFPPGTTPENAIAALGHTLITGEEQ